MNIEYLLFNLVVLSGPVALSFDKRVHFISLWPQALLASLATLVPFILWDIAVTGRHWWFNEQYTTSIRILNLPLAEWLFFISVPFACIFIWEVLKAYFPNRVTEPSAFLYHSAVPLALAAIFLFYFGLEYTGLVVAASAVTLFLDKALSTRLFAMSRTIIQMSIVTVLILIFNGYLTARPVVLYDPRYQLDFRIPTIPIEDFLYGYTHILLSIMVFEWLLRRKHG
jgi:lycopene cyclase domain-containing protein